MNNAVEKPVERAVYANLSAVLSAGSVISLLVPYIALPVALMAVIFGLVSIFKNENRTGTAACGIAIGTGVFLTAAVLIVCITALSPYMDDMMRMFDEFMKNHPLK